MLLKSQIPQSLGIELDESFDGSLYRLLEEEHKIPIAWGHEEIRAAGASDEEAKLLGLKPGRRRAGHGTSFLLSREPARGVCARRLPVGSFQILHSLEAVGSWILARRVGRARRAPPSQFRFVKGKRMP